MTTLLAEHVRRAAHDKHRCELCHEPILRRSKYLDQRCAEDGRAWTFRCHVDCNVRYWKAHRGLELLTDEPLEWSEVLEWEDSA